MTVNSIVPVVQTSKNVCGSKQHKNGCIYRILKTLHGLHVDTVNNIHDFRLQLHILANSS